jgi:glycosyltransferase involved in cell wall biosynthesis
MLAGAARNASFSEQKIFVVNDGGLLGKLNEIAYKTLDLNPPFLNDLKHLNANLIHSHFGIDGVYAQRLSEKLGLPLIVTYHGYDVAIKDSYARRSFYGHRLYLRERDKVKQSASKFIAVSNFIRKLLVEQGFAPEKIITHYIGIDVEQFQPSETVDRQPIVLFVGRLVEFKGCEYLIRAMGEVQSKLPNSKLVVIGDGYLRKNLERLASSCLIQYQFLGAQPSSVVKDWMNKAQVFSVPSIIAESGDCEAFGMVFAEAQAMKLPVVSFSTGGIPEAVVHGKTGFLAPERDWGELAKYILLLLNDTTLWTQLSEAGRRRVENCFDIKKQTKELEKIYTDVVNNSQEK